MMVYLFLADGFEEIEALATVDVLRRAEVNVKTVGVGGDHITGAHGIPVITDMIDKDLSFTDMEAVVLPGGMPGTLNLENATTVQTAVNFAAKEGKLIAAICAAPLILGHKGLLNGKNAVCFPGFENELTGAILSPQSVVTDGNIITAKGAGVATDFGLGIVAALRSEELAKKLKEAMQCK